MKLLTIKEAAEILSVHPNFIRKMISEGKLKSYQLGPRINRIDRDELMEAVQRL